MGNGNSTAVAPEIKYVNDNLAIAQKDLADAARMIVNLSMLPPLDRVRAMQEIIHLASTGSAFLSQATQALNAAIIAGKVPSAGSGVSK